ncbi:hypothetical protein TeGR_g14040 [Tetraparma gracilis]|nr:hypothetical protein TeGR_g14040 [Tetraparma gracilis]
MSSDTEDSLTTTFLVFILILSFLAPLLESSSGFGSAICFWLSYQLYSFFPGSQDDVPITVNSVVLTCQTVIGVLVILQARAWETADVPSVLVCGTLSAVVAPLGQLLVNSMPIAALKVCAAAGLLLYFFWRLSIHKMQQIGEQRSGVLWSERVAGEAGRRPSIRAEPARPSAIDVELGTLAMGLTDPPPAGLDSPQMDMYDRVPESERDDMWWNIAREERYGTRDDDSRRKGLSAEEERALVRKINNRFLKEKRGSGHTKMENVLGVSEDEVKRERALKKMGVSEKVYKVEKAMK